MVNQWIGQWYPEEDYSTYSKEKWCDLDRVCAVIQKDEYVPETDMKNLILNCIAHYEACLESGNDWLSIELEKDNDLDYGEKIKQMIEADGGWREFDYYC